MHVSSENMAVKDVEAITIGITGVISLDSMSRAGFFFFLFMIEAAGNSS